MKENGNTVRSLLLPALVAAIFIALWTVAWRAGVFHQSAFPSPMAVVRGFGVEIATAWMPFAILWFGVGDAAAMFLIFLSVFFSVVLATMAAVGTIPLVYFHVAQNYGLRPFEKLTRVTLPAIMPQVITTLRVTAGVAWLVDVAAEMIAGRDGLGFAVMDARNGLRTDLLVVEMIVIGVIGVFIDRLLVQLTKVPSVRWGYER